MPCSVFILSTRSGEKEERKTDPMGKAAQREHIEPKKAEEKRNIPSCMLNTHTLQKAVSIFEISK